MGGSLLGQGVAEMKGRQWRKMDGGPQHSFESLKGLVEVFIYSSSVNQTKGIILRKKMIELIGLGLGSPYSFSTQNPMP